MKETDMTLPEPIDWPTFWDRSSDPLVRVVPPWVFNPDDYTLNIEWETDLGGGTYWVHLDECTSSAEMLDWIMQIAGKAWATPEVLSALVQTLRRLLHPQANLCSNGYSKTLTKAALRRIIDERWAEAV